MRREDPEKDLQKGLCLLCLRERNRVRFHNLGRAYCLQLPGMRKDHVQTERKRSAEIILRESGMLEFCSGGKKKVSEKNKDSRHRKE